MKQTMSALAIATVVLSIACSFEGPTDSRGNVIWPLTVGNEWQGKFTFYTDGEIDSSAVVSFSVAKDTTIGREKWSVLLTIAESNPPNGYPSYMINRSSGLFELIFSEIAPELGPPKMLLKYPIEVGDVFESAYGPVYTVISKTEQVTTEAGTFSCILYESSDSDAYDRIYASPGAGVIKSEIGLTLNDHDLLIRGWELEKLTLK